MKNLPNEVKIDIFKCLDFYQLNKARQINKHFCALIDEFEEKLACKRQVYYHSRQPELCNRCSRELNDGQHCRYGMTNPCPMSSTYRGFRIGMGFNRMCMNCGRSFQSGSNFEFDGGDAFM
ncbi:unnamed protein product [Meloidogyne enterolobii]|uniref:Uncharacterized protein n=1 Tax=Meloidogyne enterolobii TaxID=390850 RepID=A0ACB0Y7P7_MELEN